MSVKGPEKKWVFDHKDETTGKKRFVLREVKKPVPGETPPDELDGLSKTPPSKLGRVTSESLERSRREGYPTFIEESQPPGDKD